MHQTGKACKCPRRDSVGHEAQLAVPEISLQALHYWQLGPSGSPGWRQLQQAGQASQDFLLQHPPLQCALPFDFGLSWGRQLLQTLWQPTGGLRVFAVQAEAAV